MVSKSKTIQYTKFISTLIERSKEHINGKTASYQISNCNIIKMKE